MRWTIRRKLILSISIPLIIGDLLILSWDYYRQRQNTAVFMRDVLLTNARVTARLLDSSLRRVEEFTRELAEQSRPPAPNDWVIATLRTEPVPAGQPATTQSLSFQLTDTAGRSRSISLRSDADWYQTIQKTSQARWFAPVSLPDVREEDVCIYVVPTRDGLVISVVPPQRFREAAMLDATLASPASVSGGDEIAVASLLAGQLRDFAVLTPFGQLIARPTALETLNRVANDPSQQASPLADAFVRAATGESTVVVASGIQVPGFPGQRYWAAFVPIQSTGWIFTTAVSEAAVMSPVLALLAERAALLGTGMLIMLFVVYFITVRLSVPIERLASATRRIGEGDLETQTPVSPGSDELAQLSRAFNAMVGQIRTQIDEIRRAAIAQGKIDGELRAARAIQAELLPRSLPDRADLDLYAVNVPAEQVAGDFYDFFFTSDDRLLMVIADVAGKGMPAAILMAVTRTAIRNFASAGKSPLEIARQVNRMLVEESPADMFVTMFIGEYHTATGELRYVNGGHPAAIHLTANGARYACRDTAPLLGATNVWPENAWQDATLTLAPRESIILYTDGVTEARRADGELLGNERALAIAQACIGMDARETCDHIVRQLEMFQGATPADDLTLLVLRRA